MAQSTLVGSPNKRFLGNLTTYIMAGLAILAIGFVVWLVMPYLTARYALNSETNRLADVPGLTRTSQEYASGFCLDNCPELTSTYKIPPTSLAAVRSTLIGRLTVNDYSIDMPDPGDNTLTGYKDEFHVYIGLGVNPDYSSSTSVESHDSDTIDKVIIRLENIVSH